MGAPASRCSVRGRGLHFIWQSRGPALGHSKSQEPSAVSHLSKPPVMGRVASARQTTPAGAWKSWLLQEDKCKRVLAHCAQPPVSEDEFNDCDASKEETSVQTIPEGQPIRLSLLRH